VQEMTPTWRASTWPTRRWRTVAVACVVVALSILVAQVAQDWIWGAGAALVLALVLIDAVVPPRYVADSQGLTIHGALRSRRVRWSDVQRVNFQTDGAYLTTRRRGGVTVLLDSPARGPWLEAHATSNAQPQQTAREPRAC
jgi:hypothetical protein